MFQREFSFVQNNRAVRFKQDICQKSFLKVLPNWCKSSFFLLINFVTFKVHNLKKQLVRKFSHWPKCKKNPVSIVGRFHHWQKFTCSSHFHMEHANRSTVKFELWIQGRVSLWCLTHFCKQKLYFRLWSGPWAHLKKLILELKIIPDLDFFENRQIFESNDLQSEGVSCRHQKWSKSIHWMSRKRAQPMKTFPDQYF